MKRKPDVILTLSAGKNVLIPTGEAAASYKGIISVNEMGTVLWNMLETEITKEQMLEKVLAEYDVTEDVAKKDIENFLNKLKSAGFLAD